jgi:hypothetical protein
MSLYSGKKIAVSKEEKSLPYFSLYEREMAPVPEAKIALVKEPSKVRAVPFEDRNLFLKGEDKDFCQIGYGTAEDGTGFVCNETYMPGVTGEMMDWWFPWHSIGADLRYKIWDPEDHYFARADKPGYICDPKVPLNKKMWGVNDYVLEDIGFGPSYLLLQFMRPNDFGFDESIIGSKSCQSLVCAIGDGDCAAAMAHKWVPFKDGILFSSRFWIGYSLKNGRIVKAVPEGARVPVEVSRGLFAHNIKEFTNLAAILPLAYSDNKDNF